MSYDVSCPYCGTEQDIDHDDGQGYQEDEIHQQECQACGKTFVYITTILYLYTPEKADCLNGAPHEYEPTMTWPKECTRMRCNMCGEERNPTSEELQKILKEVKS